jgi:hypothetical protein
MEICFTDEHETKPNILSLSEFFGFHSCRTFVVSADMRILRKKTSRDFRNSQMENIGFTPTLFLGTTGNTDSAGHYNLAIYHVHFSKED